jgi:hypothetical protein
VARFVLMNTGDAEPSGFEGIGKEDDAFFSLAARIETDVVLGFFFKDRFGTLEGIVVHGTFR